MELRAWRSFSCNNSSSYRLVARFADAATAADVANELRTFFEEHAKEVDASEGGYWEDSEPSEAAKGLSAKYDFEWKEPLGWGDEMLEGDEPSVSTVGDALVVYHTYCGGFGSDIRTYFEKRGARRVEKETRSAPSVSLMFRRPESPSAELTEDLKALFAPLQEEEQPIDAEPFKAPFVNRECYGQASGFDDGKTIGLHVPLAPEDYDALKSWLAKHGIEGYSMRVCEDGDAERFATIAAARCKACQAPLEYLDPSAHDIATPHLACTACGGMFELSAFEGEAK